MKSIKSDRLKKLETELHDLEEWLRLGLVPKKDVDKHRDEIRSLKTKIEEERARLQFLKEGGEGEEFIIPKRTPQKGAYNEMPTIPDDGHETGSGLTEGGFESNTYMGDETTFEEDTEEEYYTTAEVEDNAAADEGIVEEDQDEEEEDESYFSDRNRWKRGGIVDPDADEW